jgi:hypothetical protein
MRLRQNGGIKQPLQKNHHMKTAKKDCVVTISGPFVNFETLFYKGSMRFGSREYPDAVLMSESEAIDVMNAISKASPGALVEVIRDYGLDCQESIAQN